MANDARGVRLEIHFHAAPREVHFHFPPESAESLARKRPCPQALYGNIVVYTPNSLYVCVRDTGNNRGVICCMGKATDDVYGIAARVRATIYATSGHTTCSGTPVIPNAANGQFVMDVPGAYHSAVGAQNYLVICADFPDGEGGFFTETAEVEFLGITSDHTECEPGETCEPEEETLKQKQLQSMFAHPSLGFAFDRYVVHAPSAEPQEWRLRSAYGDFAMPARWNVGFDRDAKEDTPTWTTRRCAESHGAWRLMVQQVGDDLIGRLMLLAVGEMHFDKPLCWRAPHWNPVGRNRLRAEFADDDALTLIVEPAP